jgi:hypothetical protein
MNRFIRATVAFAFAAGLSYQARADEQESKAVLEKAIKALGGEEKLSRVKAFSLRGNGTITLEGNDIQFTFESTAQGIDRYRSGFEGEADGNKFVGVVIVDRDRGWRKFGDDKIDLDAADLAEEKRNAYLEITPVLILPLKRPEFKLKSAPDDKLGEKAVAVVNITGPEGKDFTIYFDKESGLPVKLTAIVKDWEDQEYTQDTTFEDYKDFDGIKVATKSHIKRDGHRYIEAEVTEFKVLDDVDPKTFAEPN